jgi:hypothetical protein
MSMPSAWRQHMVLLCFLGICLEARTLHQLRLKLSGYLCGLLASVECPHLLTI